MLQMCANYKNLTGNISHAKLNKLQNSTYVKLLTVQCIETQSKCDATSIWEKERGTVADLVRVSVT